ncbi:MAG: hypothetical protein JO290_00445, partial [Sphingomonadaceae bacterium]|nr:hypothetical protein [Sphingomonadaceae bacterium]
MRALLAAALLIVSGSAGAVPRTLEVKPTAGWQHAATGIIIMPTVAGLTRSSIRDMSDQELDLALTYQSAATATTASIYLF